MGVYIYIISYISVRPILCTGGDRSPQALSRVDLPRYLVLYGAPASFPVKPAKVSKPFSGDSRMMYTSTIPVP